MQRILAIVLSGVLCLGASGAAAEPMTLDVVLSPKDEIRLDLKGDGTHFLQLTQREGTAEAGGVFIGATVAEYGMHDVVVGEGGKAGGYFEATTTQGDTAYFRWRLRAFFVTGPDGETTVVNNGLWELAGGTGQFASMRGVGTLRLEFVSDTDRRFVLEGDLSPAP